MRRSARRPPQTRGAQPSKGQGSPSTPLQFMEGRLEPSGHAALPRRLLYCIHLAQESRDFSDRGGDSRWGSLAFPGPWKGIFFCPPVSGCSHLFIGVFNAPRHAVEVPTLLKKGATPCPAPHSTGLPLFSPSFFLSGDKY